MSTRIMIGDCIEVCNGLESDSHAACVTDPPYHLTSIVKRFGGENSAPAKSAGFYGHVSKGFMGKTWDGGDVAFRPETWAAVLRVLRPGAYLVAFASTRGYHRMVCAIEDAGFIIHPMLGWIFASGFPKAHDLSKAIDRAAGYRRGTTPDTRNGPNTNPLTKTDKYGGYNDYRQLDSLDEGPVSEAARHWHGWAYGLQSIKPAIEPICLAQKPFAEVTSDEIRAVTGWDHWCSARSDGEDKIVTARALHAEARSYRVRRSKDGRELAREDLGEYKPFVLDGGTSNVLRWGTGALNIDAGRIGTTRDVPSSKSAKRAMEGWGMREQPDACFDPNVGRWPANLAHDGSPEVLEAFARQSERAGMHSAGAACQAKFPRGENKHVYGKANEGSTGHRIGDTGTAARFFFCGKAQSWEREGNHPTVKPLALMEWLVKLVTPPNSGPVLDPFCGTGSTLVACDHLGFAATGIELDPKTCADAEHKIKRLRARRMLGADAKHVAPLPGQMGLFA